jgi:hypothetical protein
VLLLMAVLLFVASGHGCHEDQGEPLRSPVTAVAVLLQHEDGSVRAELHVVSTARVPQAALLAHDVRLTTPDHATLALDEVAPGSYALSSGDEPALTYAPDAEYQLSFSLDEATARDGHVFAGSFGVALYGLRDAPMVWIGEPAAAGGDVVVEWSPSQSALVEVVRADGTTSFRNVDFDHDPIDYDSWEALAPAGVASVPAGAFGLGDNLVRVCTVDVHRPSSDPPVQPQHQGATVVLADRLGSLSGAVAGRCAAVDVTVGE